MVCIITCYSICLLIISTRLILFQLFLLKLEEGASGREMSGELWNRVKSSRNTNNYSHHFHQYFFLLFNNCRDPWHLEKFVLHLINVINIYECIKGSIFPECIPNFRWSLGWFNFRLRSEYLKRKDVCELTISCPQITTCFFEKTFLAYPAHLWAKIIQEKNLKIA